MLRNEAKVLEVVGGRVMELGKHGVSHGSSDHLF